MAKFFIDRPVILSSHSSQFSRNVISDIYQVSNIGMNNICPVCDICLSDFYEI